MDFISLIKAIIPIFIPFISPKLAPVGPLIVQGIDEAEQLKGASGADKLAHATNIVTTGAIVANTAAGKQVIDINVINSAAKNAISTAVDIANLIKKNQSVSK